MAVQDWRPFLLKINITDIDLQIEALKERIINDQQEIVYLTIIKHGLLASKEFGRISKKKADEVINQAIEEMNFIDKAKFDQEGKIK